MLAVTNMVFALLLTSLSYAQYTPEVEAARQAHLRAYIETNKRALAEQTEALSSRPANQWVPSQNNAPLSVNIPLTQQRLGLDNETPNLFGGQSSYNSGFPVTTPYPDYSSNNVEVKHFILPTPKVHHYEKIWPLPPLQFRDVAIEVNGQNVIDPNRQYGNRNVGLLPQFNTQQKPQQNVNTFNPFAAQAVRPQPAQTVFNQNDQKHENNLFGQQKTAFAQKLSEVTFPKPNNVASSTYYENQNNGPKLKYNEIQHPFNKQIQQNPLGGQQQFQNFYSTPKPFIPQIGDNFYPKTTDGNIRNVEASYQQAYDQPQTILQLLNSNNPSPSQQNSNSGRPLKSKLDTLTAHQQDLLSFRTSPKTKNFGSNEFKSYLPPMPTARPRPVNNVRENNNEQRQDIVSNNNGNIRKNIATQAARKALEALKEKYNIS